MFVDILGIIAGVFIFASLTFKCVTVKSNVIMRVLNCLGSAMFVVYGALLWVDGGSGWSLVVCNGLLVVFNVYHIIRLCLSLKKKPTDDLPASESAENETPATEKETLRTVKELAAKCETLDELRAELAKLN